MTFDPGRIVRSHIKPIAAYAPGASPADDPETVRLDWNESPYPLSPKAQAVYDAFRSGNRYPPFAQDELIHALADYTGVEPDRIIAGAGLDDVFTTMAITIIEPCDEVIISEPTFGVYRSLFELHGATVVNVPLGPAPSFALESDAIIAAANERTKLVIVCNPNNPTGTLYSGEQIRAIVEGVNAVVAIDEAYAEFSGASHLDLANSYSNVVLLRTLSKFAGLAGFRVGYGIFPPGLMPWIRRAAPAFYNVSAISAAVAIASLNDLHHLNANLEILTRERQRIIDSANAVAGVEAYPSAANFVLIRLPFDDAGPIVDDLARRKVFVRKYSGTLASCLRVSIGTPGENATFLEALRSAVTTVQSQEVGT
jgi:histidinol-phosphate aminotransferase